VHGLADDLLSTLCLARDCPLIVAPAMNRQMWENPATRRNIAMLTEDGVRILGPAEGEQACGETGLGRMLEPEDILHLLIQDSTGALIGKRILITAGPTVEHIDPVRAITNLSSGRMGYSLAQAALDMGAHVTLVSGPTSLPAPKGADLKHVTSAEDMLNTVMANATDQDIFISVAAVSDYRPASPSVQKLKKGTQKLSIDLVPNEDILAKVAALPDGPFCVGFAAESENLLDYAEQKRRSKKLPLIAANLVSDSLGTEQTSITLLDDAGAHPLPRGSKLETARLLLQHVAHMLDAHH
jgi:phosphopantothenoylcysteine decarboxylase/phosphopantothenate--cysteine ligase